MTGSPIFFWFSLWCCSGLLLGPTLFFGGAFPLVNRLYIRSIGDMGRRMGKAYALNTLGALAGSFVAGFVLVPWIGKMNGLRIVILLQFCMSWAAAVCREPSGRPHPLGCCLGGGVPSNCPFSQLAC